MRYRRLAAVFACASIMIAACGSDDDSSDSDTTDAPAESTAGTEAPAGSAAPGDTAAPDGTSGGGDGMAAAQAVVEQYRDPNQPIGVTIPLDSVPEPQTIAWLECELESCPYITTGMEDATEALGWELMVIPSESANPGPAFQQAIDAGVDYIASSGEARSLYEEQAQAAADAGIKILSCFDTEPPAGEETNI